MEYPLNIAAFGRHDQYLSAALNLVLQDQEDMQDEKAMPLSYFKKFSCLKINISDSKKNTGGDGNIELVKLDDVYMRTQVAMQKIATAKVLEDPFAQTLGYVPGHVDCKGLSIAALADKLGFAECMSISNQLMTSGGKYEARNKATGTLIKHAAYVKAMQDANLLQADLWQMYNQAIANGNQNARFLQDAAQIMDRHPKYRNGISSQGNKAEAIDIYRAEMKTPNVSKVKDGYTKVYSLVITAIPGATTPFKVKLVIGRGKPMEDRSIGIQPNTYEPVDSFEVNLASWEWVNIISSAITTRNAYITCHVDQYMNIAHQCDQENRKRSFTAA